MAVRGLGLDVVDLERFAATLRRTPDLVERLLTPAERYATGEDGPSVVGEDPAYRPVRSLAARFAAKEALAKALGAPGTLAWHDAQVVTDEAGAPSFQVSGTIAARMADLGIQRLHLSLSHDAGIAAAVVVAEGE